MRFDVVVIGAGPSGVFAAGRAAEKGARTLVLDSNPILGKKLLITGKGRCNLTNSGDIKDFISSCNNGKFLYQAFGRYFNNDLVEFFESRGVKTKVERGGRIFPVSDEARDIVGALGSYLKASGAAAGFGKRAESVLVENDAEGKPAVRGVKIFGGETVECSKAVIATGGLSYPGTGSTGDGFRMAGELGHKITPLLPALASMRVKEGFVERLSGLSLKNIEITMFSGGRKAASEFGEMLFTHHGVSGPVILTLSGGAAERLSRKEKIEISINFKPALDREKLTARLLREIDSSGLKAASNILKTLLPQSLIPVFLELSGIEPGKKGNQITRADREKLYGLLTDFRLEVTGTGGFNEAIVTRGGVSLGEIDPKTMSSKIVRGLYFCGEVIDVDGLTGGYNLQAAFSTGYLAGDSAAEAAANERI